VGDGALKTRVSLTDRSRDLTSQKKDSWLNVRSSLRAWEDGEVELYVGGMDVAFAEPGVLGVANGAYNELYGMAQLHQKFGENSFELMGSRKQSLTTYGGLDAREVVHDLDTLLRFSLMDGKALGTVGGSFRHSRAESKFIFNRNGYPPRA